MAINPQPEEYLHGIPMTEEAFERLIASENPYKYELIDGVVYDMTGSSRQHADLAGNIEFSLRTQLVRAGPCKVYHDQYVYIPDHTPVVPDVVLTCNIADRDKNKASKPFRIYSPLIVIEVLSPSTEKYDKNEKFALYRRCETLEAYILVSQNEPLVKVYRQENDWREETFKDEQIVHLDQLDLEISLPEIYEGVL